MELLSIIGALALVAILIATLVLAIKANQKAGQVQQKLVEMETRLTAEQASLKTKIKEKTEEIGKTAENQINNKLNEIVGVSGSFLDSSSAKDKIIEKIISLLGDPHSGFATRFVKVLASAVAEKIDLTGDLFTSILKNSAGPEISKTLQVKVKEMINNEDWDFGDRLQETLEEHFPTLIKEIMDDSNLKTGILEKIKNEIEERAGELFSEEIENDSDIVMAPIKERLDKWLATELDNPESEFRQRIIEVLKDRALQAIEE